MGGCVTSFTGAHRFLSNFWPAAVSLDHIIYPTVEHAYQAAKSVEPAKRAIVRMMPNPAMARTAGRRLGVRRDWVAVKVEVMRHLLEQKFAAGSHLADALDATGEMLLEEGNTWGDRFWGVYGGTGANTLGRMLMAIRTKNRDCEFAALLG
ncbi:hypothetical protein BES08_07020 [Novosphingobium resinovorum]|uniref:NADAR domain-containing protein n=2 Tax=Novosphingobium resinovorum TaxID=158500 RepID=A0A1D8A8W1_9SPHN|nr:hypothetical protein BES08_07020 [Novosphingobium resinovorum]